MIRQIHSRGLQSTAKLHDPAQSLVWEVPNALVGRGWGGERSLSMCVRPDNITVMQSHAGTIMSPLQREDIHDAISQAVAGCLWGVLPWLGLVGDAKASGQGGLLVGVVPPNPEGNHFAAKCTLSP